jgi:hypothetical protein
MVLVLALFAVPGCLADPAGGASECVIGNFYPISAAERPAAVMADRIYPVVLVLCGVAHRAFPGHHAS